jgi:hypothetical protein
MQNIFLEGISSTLTGLEYVELSKAHWRDTIISYSQQTQDGRNYFEE